jgi:hypothetical protein
LEVGEQRTIGFRDSLENDGPERRDRSSSSYNAHWSTRPDQDTSKLPFSRPENLQFAGKQGETSAPIWPFVFLHVEHEVRGRAGFGQRELSVRYEKSLGSVAPFGALASAGLLTPRLAGWSAGGTTPSLSETEG